MASIFDASNAQRSALTALLNPTPADAIIPNSVKPVDPLPIASFSNMFATAPATAPATPVATTLANLNLADATLTPAPAPTPTSAASARPDEIDWSQLGLAPTEREGPDAYINYLFNKLALTVNSITHGRDTLVEIHQHLKQYPKLLLPAELGNITAVMQNLTAGAHRVATAAKSTAQEKATVKQAELSAFDALDAFNPFG